MDDVQQGAAANGFTRHSLTTDEAWALYRNRYPAPPDMRCPGTWRLNASGIPITPVPQGARRCREIAAHFYNGLNDAQRADPIWDPESNVQGNVFFQNRREAELAEYEGNGPPPARNNTEGRELWWSAEGRTLAAVMDHIRAGGERLHPPPRRPPAPT